MAAEGLGGVRDILDRPSWGGNIRLYQMERCFICTVNVCFLFFFFISGVGVF